MPSERPYIRMSLDDLEKKFRNAESDFVSELRPIDNKLGHRRTDGARKLHLRVSEALKSLEGRL